MLIFVDGCSHYSGNADLAKKWDVVSAAGVTHSLTGGRFGTGRITFALGGGSFDKPLYIQKNYDGVSTIIFGMALKQTATQQPYGGQWLEFLDGNRVQVGLAIMPSGQIQAFRSGDVGVILHPQSASERTILGTSTSAIASSSYDFLEVKIVHHPTTGSITIRRNGTLFWELLNVNTAISGANNSSSVVVGGYVAFGGASIDVGLQADLTDFALLNTTVNASDALDPVDFIGDRRWEPLPPTQDGADTAWTTTGSASHFANVDEVPPNESDFNSTPTVGARDGFVVQSPIGPAAASALVAVTMFCKKDTGGSNAIKAFARSGGGVYRNGTEFQVPNPYAFRQSFLCSKPGGGAITVADVASHQWGYEKTI